jgi:hypothetical protein
MEVTRRYPSGGVIAVHDEGARIGLISLGNIFGFEARSPKPTSETRSASDGRSHRAIRERHGDSVNETAQRETPHVGIFWLAQTTEGEVKLLASGCAVDQAEPYGDCLTYGAGHYETWAQLTRKQYSAEEKIRIVLDGLRGDGHSG